jgi:hypothetical protein
LDSSKDPDHALHSTLYYSYLISHPSGDEEETKGDAATPGAAAAGGGNDHAPDMLSSEWLGALEESTSYTCWDLVYNHQRWRSWDFLGQEYEQALQVRNHKGGRGRGASEAGDSPGKCWIRLSRQLHYRCYVWLATGRRQRSWDIGQSPEP